MKRAARERTSLVKPRCVVWAGLLIVAVNIQGGAASRRRLLVNAHEHVQDAASLEKLREGMRRSGIERTLLLGSPRFTFVLGDAGFTDYDENNEFVLESARRWPNEFIPFVVINPEDDDAIEKLEHYLARGARGVKLFAGHGGKHGQGPFHTMSLVDERLLGIYEVLERRGVPVLYHVNFEKFGPELEAVLRAFPKLPVLCPHFCLALNDDSMLRRLLSTYPNFWTDISFGYVQFQIEGFRRLSERADAVRKLMEDFPDRFIFGTDLVITNMPVKSPEWISANVDAYRAMLESEEYSLPAPIQEAAKMVLSAKHQRWSRQRFRGLHLPDSLLRRIYGENADDWLASSAVRK